MQGREGIPGVGRAGEAEGRMAQSLGREALAAPEVGQTLVSRSGRPSHCVSGPPWGDGAGEGPGREGPLAGDAAVRMVISDPGRQGGKQETGPQDGWEPHSPEQGPTSGPRAAVPGGTCQATCAGGWAGGWRWAGAGVRAKEQERAWLLRAQGPLPVRGPGEHRRDAGRTAGDRDGAAGTECVGLAATEADRAGDSQGRVGRHFQVLLQGPGMEME